MFSWTPETLQEQQEIWIIDIPKQYPPLLDWVTTAHQSLRNCGNSWRDYNKLSLPEPILPLIQSMKTLLYDQIGITKLVIGPTLNHEQARLLFLLLGCQFGENVSRSVGEKKRPLFKIRFSEESSYAGQYLGNGRNRKGIGLHTDGSGTAEKVNILGLLCLQPAWKGGATRVSNSQEALKALRQTTKEIIFKPLPRMHPYKPNLPPSEWVNSPIYDPRSIPGLSFSVFSYHPDRVRGAIRKIFGQNKQKLLDALDELDEVLEEYAVDIVLKKNEILFLNNRAIAHGRTKFVDRPNKRRFLERFWAGTLDKEVPPSFGKPI